jgi:hypothetical protein
VHEPRRQEFSSEDVYLAALDAWIRAMEDEGELLLDELFENHKQGDVMPQEEGICPHQCVGEGCDIIVQFDDEPWCFTHSPDAGSSLAGYSARARLAEGVPTVFKNTSLDR